MAALASTSVMQHTHWFSDAQSTRTRHQVSMLNARAVGSSKAARSMATLIMRWRLRVVQTRRSAGTPSVTGKAGLIALAMHLPFGGQMRDQR